MAEPIIYTKNYVNEDDTFSVSHGSSSFANAYDRDVDSQWESVGANSDLTDVTIDITFYQGSVAVERTIDRMILLNHNLKSYDLYYWDGATFQSWLSASAQTGDNHIKTLTSHTTSIARLVIHTTQTSNAEKAIGELVLCEEQLALAQDMAQYEVIYDQNTRDVVAGDGTFQRKIKKFSENRYQKYAAAMAFNNLSESNLENLLAIKDTGQPFLWQPESTARPDELYYVDWVDAIKYRYQDLYKGAGFHVEFSVKEK